jgi:hypothetical protein
MDLFVTIIHKIRDLRTKAGKLPSGSAKSELLRTAEVLRDILIEHQEGVKNQDVALQWIEAAIRGWDIDGEGNHLKIDDYGREVIE